MYTINNREEIISTLTDILVQFDKDEKPYYTDVYLYYDEETQTARLTTFENVGGRSWLDDDHFTIYSDKPHDSDIEYYYQDDDYIARVIGIPYVQMLTETRNYHNYDDDDTSDPEWWEIWQYVTSRDDYSDALYEDYYSYIDDMYSDYKKQATEIIGKFEDGEEDEI